MTERVAGIPLADIPAVLEFNFYYDRVDTTVSKLVTQVIADTTRDVTDVLLHALTIALIEGEATYPMLVLARAPGTIGLKFLVAYDTAPTRDGI